ncbi:MAG: VCBS repeat-containing protein, partial [Candidatus Poribacteria bacterium]|nr:VCBS repeat-containing protein [Candidatus Poribacteria bacterium]
MALCATIALASTFSAVAGDEPERPKGFAMDRDVSEWTMDRHDRRMTGRTSLKGRMAETPKVVWRHYLGRWSNHLVVSAATGANHATVLPDEEFGAEFYGGSQEQWGFQQDEVDVDGRGGMLRPTSVAGEKLVKLLPDVNGYQRVEFDNAFEIGAERNVGRLIAFDDGIDAPRVVWQTERVKDMYSPVVAVADTDLDGRDEIVMMTQYHIAVYDARTGVEKDSVYWKVGRNYGQLDVVDVDGDGRPDFVIQGDAVPHLEYIRNGPDGAKLVWTHRFLEDEADVAVPMSLQLHNLPNAVRDLDGDGRLELAVNLFDFKEDGVWHIVIYDALTGEVKTDLPSRYLWGVSDLDRDGKTELLMSDAPERTVERPAVLRIARYTGDGIDPIWESPQPGEFCLRPYFFPLSANSASSRGPVHHSVPVIGDVNDDGELECFATMGNVLVAVGRDGIVWKMTSPTDAPPTALACRPDGRTLVRVYAESGEVSFENARGELRSHYREGGYRATPIVADLDGDGRNAIIVENGDGEIVAFDPPPDFRGAPRVRWTVEGDAQPIWVTWKVFHASPLAVDLDGDGRKEVLCVDAANEPHTTLYALRSDGSVYWKSELAEFGPRLSERFGIGYFRPDGADVLLTVRSTTQPEMLCLHGRTGEIRWHRSEWVDPKGRTWPYPDRWTAADLDGDGFDEIYGSYAY